MTHLHRFAGIGVLALLAWASACANKDTTCAAGYNTCGPVCCSGACAGDSCEAPAGNTSSGGATSSSGSPFGPKDPECEDEQLPSRTKFCASVGKCIDPKTDSDNCGKCDNVCGEDTNGLSLSCFQGKCQ